MTVFSSPKISLWKTYEPDDEDGKWVGVALAFENIQLSLTREEAYKLSVALSEAKPGE